jgi:hypothetical protein
MLRNGLVSKCTSHHTNTSQLAPEMTKAEMISGLPQANVSEPACWTANTRKPELVRRVALPRKSMLVKAFHEKKCDTSSCGQRFVIVRITTKPKGMLTSSVFLQVCASQYTYFMLNNHLQSES